MARDPDGHKVKIVCDTPDFTGARVWIDDKEVVGLTSVQVGVKVPEANTVKLELIPDALEIDVAAEAIEVSGIVDVIAPAPGATLIVRPVKTLTDDELKRIAEQFAERFPDHRIAVIPPGEVDVEVSGGSEQVTEVKRIDIAEFRSEGYLQELNRRFLHPLGLALEVVVEEDGTEHLGGIWDYRDDPEGIYYDGGADADKAATIDRLLAERSPAREAALGFVIEPVELGESAR